MSDDERSASTAEIFKHFDHAGAVDQRTQRIRAWAFGMFCWDGILPVLVILIPNVIATLFANQAVLEITFLVVPIAAFLIRYLHGIGRFKKGHFRAWQLGAFVIAIFVLFVFDVLLTISALANGPKPDGFWLLVALIYCIYLTVMAVAMYPVEKKIRPNVEGKA